VGDLSLRLIHTGDLVGESPMGERCAVLQNAARAKKHSMAWMHATTAKSPQRTALRPFLGGTNP